MAGLTKKQLEQRRKGIGASEIGTVAGLSPWGKPIEVYSSKVSSVGRDATLAMDLGTLTEDPIAQLYAKRTGRFLERVGTVVHPTDPLVIATPDRAVHLVKRGKGSPRLEGADRLLQVKHTSMQLRDRWGAPGTDDVPEEIIGQVTWEMGATGVKVCDVAVLFDKVALEVYTVRFSEPLFEGLREIAHAFWRDHVVPRIPPPAEASERYKAALVGLFPSQRRGELLAATPELEDQAHDLRILKALAKVVDERIELIENRFRLFIGEATGFTSRAGTITWKKNADSQAVNWSAIAQELIGVVDAEKADAPYGCAGVDVDAIIKRHTSTKVGERVLRKSWTKTLPPALETPPALQVLGVLPGPPALAASTSDQSDSTGT